MALSVRQPLLARSRPALSTTRPSRVLAGKIVCSAQPHEDIRKSFAAPMAAMVAAAMIAGAFVPDEAIAAKSSGRAGGSSGFSARKSYSATSSPSMSARPSVSSTTVVVAPSVFAPPIFSPFGGFGYGYGGFMPVPIFGSFFQFIFLALAVSVVFNVVRGFQNSGNKSSGEKKDDGWGDL